MWQEQDLNPPPADPKSHVLSHVSCSPWAQDLEDEGPSTGTCSVEYLLFLLAHTVSSQVGLGQR